MSLRYAALGLLAQQPGSGYDLLKRFENSMANVWPATQSQLYGELNKLADAGLIEVTDIGPRGRKEYRVTKAGREDLLRWMTDADDDPPFRSAGLLRVFLLGEMPPGEARAYVVAVAEHADADLARYNRTPRLRRLGRRLLRTRSPGVRHPSNAMEADWAKWLIKQIDRRSHN